MKRVSLLKKAGVVLGLAVTLVAAGASRADAAFAIRLTDTNSGAPVIITDGGAGDLSGAGDGLIVAALTVVGDFLVTGTFAVSAAPNGSVGLSISETNIINTAGTAQSLLVEVSATDFSLPVGSPLLLQNTLSGTATLVGDPNFDATLLTFGEADAGNTLFGATAATGVEDCVLGGAGLVDSCAADLGSTLFARAGNFSLTGNTTITMDPSGQGSSVSYTERVAVLAVPEPGSLLLLGSALLGFTAITRRRRKS